MKVIVGFLTGIVVLFSAAFAQDSRLLPVGAQCTALSLRGIKIHPEDPFKLDFIVDTGDSSLPPQAFKNEVQKLIEYFLAGLTIPEKDLWVNLSPFEANRIISDELGLTQMGQDMLAQDYILKQVAASLTYPENSAGKNFWDTLQRRQTITPGTNGKPVNMFNKVWIIPGSAVVYQDKDKAFIHESKLKVMVEEDYSANAANHSFAGRKQSEAESREAAGTAEFKQQILPLIEEEINTGEKFAQLRQVYNSLLLAVWFKEKIRESIVNKIYSDKKKILGVNTNDPMAKEKIYKKYLEALKAGAYDYIKKDFEPVKQKFTKRRYYSGGLDLADTAKAIAAGAAPYPSDSAIAQDISGRGYLAATELSPAHVLSPDAIGVSLCFLADIRDEYRVSEIVGMESLSGVLRRAFPGKVKVANHHYIGEGGVKGIIERIKQERPKILGLSLFFESLTALDQIMGFIQSLPPGERPLVVAGNVMATYNTELILKKYPEMILCIGEGEEMIRDVVRYYRGEIKKDKITNAAYLEDGAVHYPARKPVDLSMAGSPSRDLLPQVIATGGLVFVETSRNCGFNCTICARQDFLGSKGWRGRLLDDVMGDIVQVCRAGASFVNIPDEDIFGGGIERVNELSDRIIRYKRGGLIPYNVSFSASVSVRSIYIAGDPDWLNDARYKALEHLKNAGLSLVNIGIETGSPEQLKLYGKAATMEENEEAIRRTEKLGLFTQPALILVDPTVKRAQLRVSLDFIKRMGMKGRSMYPIKTYKLMAGAPLTYSLRKKGLAREYDPQVASYDYVFENADVAMIMERIKSWELSQHMFLWHLKSAVRASDFKNLGADAQRHARELLEEQTALLFDYFDALVDCDSEDQSAAASKLFSDKLVDDMRKAMGLISSGKLHDNGAELSKSIYAGVAREALRNRLAGKTFSIGVLAQDIKSSYGMELDATRLEQALNGLIDDAVVVRDGSTYTVIGDFREWGRKLHFHDLPRPALASDGAGRSLPNGGVDFDAITMKLKVRGRAVSDTVYDNFSFDLKDFEGFTFDILKLEKSSYM